MPGAPFTLAGLLMVHSKLASLYLVLKKANKKDDDSAEETPNNSQPGLGFILFLHLLQVWGLFVAYTGHIMSYWMRRIIFVLEFTCQLLVFCWQFPTTSKTPDNSMHVCVSRTIPTRLHTKSSLLSCV